jgi:hypothetical protein
MSLKFRADRTQVNDHNQTLAYCDWIGGPTLSRVEGAILAHSDPAIKNRFQYLTRTAWVTGHPDTYFSLPAKVRAKGKAIHGYLTTTDGLWEFRPFSNDPNLSALFHSWKHYSSLDAIQDAFNAGISLWDDRGAADACKVIQSPADASWSHSLAVKVSINGVSAIHPLTAADVPFIVSHS